MCDVYCMTLPSPGFFKQVHYIEEKGNLSRCIGCLSEGCRVQLFFPVGAYRELVTHGKIILPGKK